MNRINVRVFAARKRELSTGKTQYLQECQIDQDNATSTVFERKYWDEKFVMEPGLYTARQTFYTISVAQERNGKTYNEKRVCVAFGDFVKA